MTTTKAQEIATLLRPLAEAAPRVSKWEVLPAREPIDGTHSHSIMMDGYGVIGYWKGHKSAHTDADWLLTKEAAEFIAAADPATVITLLDAMEALQEEVARLKAAAPVPMKDYLPTLQKIEAVEAERDAALARLAELGKQEPLATVKLGDNNFKYIHFVAQHWSHVLDVGSNLYAAAGASPQPVAWPIDGDKAKRIAEKHFVTYEVAQDIARDILAGASPVQPLHEELRALAMEELYEFQEATGCDSAAEFRAQKAQPTQPLKVGDPLPGAIDLSSVWPVETHASVEAQQGQAGELSDDEITNIARTACAEGRLLWVGFSKDADGRYTVPVLSPSDFKLVREVIAAINAKGSV